MRQLSALPQGHPAPHGRAAFDARRGTIANRIAADNIAALPPPFITAGTGDVLAGMIGAMFAQKFDMVEATLSAVWLHGRAGEIAAEKLTDYGVTPEDVIAALPAAIGEVLA